MTDDELNFEEHEDHPDERWLVSYADMMTLLFGLFVLLFSMSTMDPESSKKIKESTEKQFGEIEVEDETKTEEVTEDNSEKLAAQNALILELNQEVLELTSQLQVLTREKDDLLQQNQELMTASEPEPIKEDNSAELRLALQKSHKELARLENKLKIALADDQSAELKNQIKELEGQLASRATDKERFNRFKAQIMQLRSEKEALRKAQLAAKTQYQELQLDLKSHKEEVSSYQKQIVDLKGQLALAQKKRNELIGKAKSFAQRKLSQSKELSSQVKDLERKLASVSSVEDKLKTLQSSFDALSKEHQLEKEQSRSLASQNKALSTQMEALTKKNADLKSQIEKEIRKRMDDQSRRTFMAFSINWSSRDHDIDLIIEDPKGQKFDFKKRKYSGHPGFFSLDTRRGPGAELWQTERLIPGRYKASYYFYNQYGNVSKAKVAGTIFTPKGSTELPMVEMDFSKNRRHEIIFDVENDGTIKFVSK